MIPEDAFHLGVTVNEFGDGEKCNGHKHVERCLRPNIHMDVGKWYEEGMWNFSTSLIRDVGFVRWQDNA